MKKKANPSKEELYQFWQNPNKGNEPSKYLNKTERSKFLYEYVQKYVDETARILEPGCNVGRNLNYLFEKGYTHLTGIEINEDAVQLLKKHYPKMSEEIQIFTGPIEDVIQSFETNSFDLTFSMAVLEHIHPDSDWIFSELARVTKSYLIIIESETWDSDRHFPRNYKKIFERLGFNQIEENTDCEGFGESYICRVFKKKKWFS